MRLQRSGCVLLICISGLVAFGCKGMRHLPTAPGDPANLPEAVRPDQVSDFATLYRQNCAACHGANGKDGAALSLANPVYLAIAGEQRIEQATSEGVPGTLMPAFAQSAGGMLTDKQIAIIADGMLKSWSNPEVVRGVKVPPYMSSLKADAADGQRAFEAYCVQCHAMNAPGGNEVRPSESKSNSHEGGALVDPAFLALISDQGLRSIVIAGQPEEGMPDWRSDSSVAEPLSDQQITDIVAWLGTYRTSTPGQVYQNHR